MARLIAPKTKPGADDFEILFPEASVSVGSRVFTIREYAFLDGLRLTDVIRKALEAHGKGQSADLVYLIAENCGADPLFIAGLEDEAFERFVKTYQRVNRALIETPLPVSPKHRNERWSSVMQALAQNGHRIEDVKRYTMRQVNLFHAAIARLDSRHRASRIVDTNLGFGGGDAANSTIRSLQRAGE